MEAALKAAFESQFGTDWSEPVAAPPAAADNSSADEFEGFSSESDADTNSAETPSSDEDGPIVVKHDEHNGGSAEQSAQQLTKAQKRRFLNSGGAPRDDTILPSQEPKTGEEHLDLKNDLELQRLIEESHILKERPKGQEFSGADISGVGDPMELVGKNRLKLMQARLARAGAKQTKQRMPQAMAVGIRNKNEERTAQHKHEAREAGIVLAREQHVRSKNRKRDAGLRINTIGRASEHGIHISAAERDRVRKQSQASKPRRHRK